MNGETVKLKKEGIEVQFQLFKISVPDASERSNSRPGRVPPPPPRKNPGTHGTRDWVSPKASTYDFEENARNPAEIRTRTVQPVANLYADYIISAPVTIRIP
jgi:hypothetical protein